MSWDVLVVGAGAAGVFCALTAKEYNPDLKIAILEKAPRPLRKVAISGGGRCNVTHDCQDLDRLLASYPRGGYRLEPILSRFMPQDTIHWFESRGVKLKTEADGRMFPITNKSQTIIDCLLGEAKKLGVEILTKIRVQSLTGREGAFQLSTSAGEQRAKKLVLATGGASKATQWLQQLGHELEPDIPSLFTFCCEDELLADLPGLSVPKVSLRLRTEPEYEAEGPLLITHWGLSGPGVLKLSAFAARTLAGCDYRAELICDWLPDMEQSELESCFVEQTSDKQVGNSVPSQMPFPKRLWRKLVKRARVGDKTSWRNLSAQQHESLASLLKRTTFQVNGKGQFKEEFVTSGGLPLHEIDVYTMESRRTPGLYCVGELLNVDGVTGGFNFQNAWATGYVAGLGLA